MILSRRMQDERGDTIVEVLIAIAIVSLVLASGYAITNKNVAAIQEAQEQSYGQKLVQQQVEYLRDNPVLATAPGCFTGPITYGTGASCDRTNGGAVYNMKITPAATPPPGATFAITATWDTLTGSTAHITVYYRPQ